MTFRKGGYKGNFKQEASARTLGRTRFGRGHGPVVRQIREWMEWMNEWMEWTEWSETNGMHDMNECNEWMNGMPAATRRLINSSVSYSETWSVLPTAFLRRLNEAHVQYVMTIILVPTAHTTLRLQNKHPLVIADYRAKHSLHRDSHEIHKGHSTDEIEGSLIYNRRHKSASSAMH